MVKKAFSSFYLLLTILIVIIAVNLIKEPNLEYQNNPIKPSPAIPKPEIPHTILIDEKYIRLDLPADWRVLRENYVDLPENLASEAYILQKGNYMLYVSPNTAISDVQKDGRYSDIIEHIPSASLIHTSQLSLPCEEDIKTNLGNSYLRGDLFVSNTSISEWCKKPLNGTIWYGSYVSTADSGYFGELNKISKENTDSRFLIVYGFEGISDINVLPQKDSPELNEMLVEMDNIVKSIVFK